MANVQTVTHSPVLVKRVLDDVHTLLEAKQKGSPATVAALTKEVTAELALFGFFADRPKLTLDTLENIQQVISELEVIYQQVVSEESESNTIDKQKMDELLADAPADHRNELKTSDSLTHALDQFKEQVKAAEKKILSVEQLRADVVEMIIQEEAAKAPDVDAYNRISAKRPLIEAAVNKAIHKPQDSTATFTHTVTRQLEDSKLFTKDNASAVQVMLIQAFEHDYRVQLLQKNNSGASDFINSVKTGLTTQSDPTIQAAISERLVQSGLDNQTAVTVASEIQSQALQAGFSNQLVTASSLESTINTIAAAHQVNLVTQDLKDITLVTNAFIHAVESHEVVQNYIQPAIITRVNSSQALTALPLTETWLAINHPQFGQPEFKDTELYNTINQSIAAEDLKSFWDYIQQFIASPAEFGYISTIPTANYSQVNSQPAQYTDYSPQVGMPGLDNVNIPPSLFRSALSGTPLGMKVDGLLGRFGLPSLFGSTITGAGGSAAAAATATQGTAIAGGVSAATGLSLATFMGYAALAVLIVVVGIWIFMYFFGGQKLQAIYTIPTAAKDAASDFSQFENPHCSDAQEPLSGSRPSDPIAARAYDIVSNLYQGIWCYWNWSKEDYPELFDESLLSLSGDQALTHCYTNGCNIFWCTWLVVKAYSETGHGLNANLLNSQTMENYFRNTGGYQFVPRSSASASTVRPGAVVFFHTYSGPARTNHVAIVTSVDSDSIEYVQSNGGTKTGSITLGSGGAQNLDWAEITGFGMVD